MGFNSSSNGLNAFSKILLRVLLEFIKLNNIFSIKKWTKLTHVLSKKNLVESKIVSEYKLLVIFVLFPLYFLSKIYVKNSYSFNPLNAELNPICHLLAL